MPRKPKSSTSPLTAKQTRVLNYIAAFVGSEGRPPSLEEIRDHLGLSAVSTVHEHVGQLVEKGYLSRQWNRSRSIEMAEGSRRWTRLVPLVGRIMAGKPFEELHTPEEIGVPAAFATGPGDFAVTVGDDSFAEHGIVTDDTLVIAARADFLRAGGLVLGTTGDEATVLVRVADADRKHRVAGAGASGPMDFRVLGEVAGLLRTYGERAAPRGVNVGEVWKKRRS
jgi:repressor LexA